MNRRSLITSLAGPAVCCALAACGGYGVSKYPQDFIECSLTMPAGSTDADVQRAVDDVLNGQVNACSNSDSSQLQAPELISIDRDDQEIHLNFRYPLDWPRHLQQ